MLNVTEKIVEMSPTAPPMINEAGWEIYFGAANAAAKSGEFADAPRWSKRGRAGCFLRKGL